MNKQEKPEKEPEERYQRELDEKGELLNRTPLGPGREVMRRQQRAMRKRGSGYTKSNKRKNRG